MLPNKDDRTKISLCSINDTVARKIARSKFKELFDSLIYNKSIDRFEVSIKVDVNSMNEKKRKELKEKIADFEQDKEWINVFKVEVLNKVQL